MQDISKKARGKNREKRNPWDPYWVEKAGDWAVDFVIDGRRFRRRLGVRTFDMKSRANEEAKRFYSEAWDEMKAPAPVERPTKTPFYLAALRYMQQGKEKRFLPRIIEYFGEDTMIEDIDTLTIAAAAAALYPHAKPETVKRQLKTPIKAIINFAQGTGREKSHDTKRTRWLTPEEVERVLYFACNPHKAGLHDPHLRTLQKIAFMLGGGAGPGETFAAQAENWNSATSEWWLDGTKTTYRARFVLLPARSIDLIGDVPERGSAFLAPDGQPYVPRENGGGQMAGAFNKIREAAGLGKDVVPYTLRHTWATWFYAQTKDFRRLVDLGGWNKSDTANRYCKVAPKDLGNRLLQHGWDFREDIGGPVKYGELVTIRR
ncbi:tyrosine-type recombinase/integrase [Thioclava electrotropha]|uniref:Tyrosine-type recombinase/integrase n=1 Tax=Thioclava electrotropha TaxID=1549850 RepID=A0ABX6YUN8_9RHOB|nr:tyrosine-type recombinase/integrase [Thioclava electrotropha]QPZ91569.1 tyrosine-type recombinase/integrase [Thioclava electrotropha]